MPKFTQEELEEIRRNTEEVEQARQGKKKESAKAEPKKRRRSKPTEVFSVRDRLIALGLLLATILVSVLVWQLYPLMNGR